MEEEIVSCDKTSYHHDEFRLRKYGEGEQKGSDQLLSLNFDQTKVKQSTFNIDIDEGKDQQHKKVFPIAFYEHVASNHDKELGNIFSDLFQNFIADTPIQEPSSLSLGSYLDAPIFNKYSDEEEEVKICEDLLFTQRSSSSSYQQRDDKKCVKL